MVSRWRLPPLGKAFEDGKKEERRHESPLCVDTPNVADDKIRCKEGERKRKVVK